MVSSQQIGVPYGSLTIRGWGKNERPWVDEWSIGAGLAGWQAWHEYAFCIGGQKSWPQSTRFEWLFRPALNHWRDVRMTTASVRLDLAFTREWELGLFRIETSSELRSDRSLLFGWRDEIVARGNDPWGWEIWWLPQVNDAVIAMPAFGWNSFGSWLISWNLNESWMRQLRLWRTPVGKLNMTWGFPEFGFELTRKVPVGRSKNRPKPSTVSPDFEENNEVHHLALGSHSRHASSAWTWSWNWSRDGS